MRYLYVLPLSLYGISIFILPPFFLLLVFIHICSILLKLFDFLSRFKFGKDTPHGNGDSRYDKLASEWKQFC